MRRIIKIGGSLLEQPDLVVALTGWFEKQPPAWNGVIVGGGKLVEALRELDDRFQLDPVKVHWRCLDLLRTTWDLMSELFPAWQRVEDPLALERLFEQDPCATQALIAVDAFYYPSAVNSEQILMNWTTTSDSLAAHLATHAKANELVLLKSCPIPQGQSLSELARLGIVDPQFPSLAAQLPRVRIESLQHSFRVR